MITFSGVRSSCDIVATKSDLIRPARSSSSTRRAFSSAIEPICAMPRAILSSCRVKDSRSRRPPQ
jgi:hypothetical protein